MNLNSMDERYAFGLVGYPLGHSLSPLVHSAALSALGVQGTYHLFPLEHEDELPGLLNLFYEGKLQGLNVTIPYKRVIRDHLDEISPAALAIGAVNSISKRNDHLYGDNTDAGGFQADLKRLGWFQKGDRQRHGLILGAGGSARAVAYILLRDGWTLIVAARRMEQAEMLVSSLAQHNSGHPGRSRIEAVQLGRASLSGIGYPPDLIVNTTPLGMHPDVDSTPWPLDLPLLQGAAVYDLVYNPIETTLIRKARNEGLRTANGTGMLVEQAALSFEVWTGLVAPRAVMQASLERYFA